MSILAKRTSEHYYKIMQDNHGAGVGFSLAASAIYAANFGACEAEHRETEQWKGFALAIKEHYGESIDAIDVVRIMEAILAYNNDPDVGGPDDPLDHEDYADLELLGLWPDGPQA